MKTKIAVRICIVMAALITLLAGVSAGLQFQFKNNWPFIALGVGTGVIMFFGLLILCQTEERWKITGESMRTAMAGAIVIEYLTLVGTLAFFVQSEMPPIAQTMITNFTTVVGIVIAFYFGASAFVQLQKGKQQNRKVRADENTVDATATSPEVEKL